MPASSLFYFCVSQIRYWNMSSSKQTVIRLIFTCSRIHMIKVDQLIILCIIKYVTHEEASVIVLQKKIIL